MCVKSKQHQVCLQLMSDFFFINSSPFFSTLTSPAEVLLECLVRGEGKQFYLGHNILLN